MVMNKHTSKLSLFLPSLKTKTTHKVNKNKAEATIRRSSDPETVTKQNGNVRIVEHLLRGPNIKERMKIKGWTGQMSGHESRMS